MGNGAGRGASRGHALADCPFPERRRLRRSAAGFGQATRGRRTRRRGEHRARDRPALSNGRRTPGGRYCAEVSTLRLILVSDTHLSPAGQEAQANWDAVLAHVDAEAPDAVIHLGDLTQDGAHDPGSLDYGRRGLARRPLSPSMLLDGSAGSMRW